ncbi:hypothetical protein P5Y53_03795 [Dyella jiangningensis]|uniref:hypothetical protein n=1 Tax=Dyella jiangningensis TaxID=1379159 RepID=UPI00240ED0A1|nr:hypothetical protein [Dyella jiangningensis]MDG2536773.1 hypothetical protein [Dyella jiangningensis]
MNTHDHDDDSLHGEDELKALYGSLPRKEPSPSLDQAVHRMAANAVRPAKRRARWPAMAASIAVLVLAGGISWRLYEQSPDRAPLPAPAATSQDAATSAGLAAPAPKATTEPAATVAPSLATSTPAMAQRQHESIRTALKPRVLPAAPSTRRAVPAQVAPPAPAAQDQVMEASTPVPTPAPPASQAPAAAQAYAPSPLAQEARANDSRHAMAAKMMAAPAPAAVAPADPTASNPADSPEQELDKIRQLFAQQRRDEALQRLSAFRQAHPDIPVPGDLQDQQTHHE